MGAKILIFFARKVLKISIFALKFSIMSFDLILRDFIRQTRVHPNVTAFKLNDSLITNSQFVQRIAPIMNELDTTSGDAIAILMENEVQTYAAVVAGLLSNKLLVPVQPHWSKQQLAKVLAEHHISEPLTAHRMGYYYWMTVEDAIDRIDNGLIHLDDQQAVAAIYHFDESGQRSLRMVLASEIRSLNVVADPFL